VTEDDKIVLENTRLRESEQTHYLQYHGDGLLDIFIGLWLVGFGLWILADATVFIAMIPVLCVPVWRSIKKSITARRMGQLDFTPRPNARLTLMGIMLFLVLSVALGFVLGLVVYRGLAAGDTPPPWLLAAVAWVRAHTTLVFGLFGAFLFGVSAAMSGLKRLYAYALLTVIIAAGGYLLGAPFWLTAVFLGAIIFFSGTVLLLRFLHRYPVETGSEA
jgi:hypothetical protein